MRASVTKRNTKKIVAAVAAGKSDAEIAKIVGVSRESIWRARKDPEIAAAVAEFKANLLAAVGHDFEEATRDLIDNIRRGLKTATGSEAAQLQERLFDAMERLQPMPIAAVVPMQPQGNIFDTTAARGTPGSVTLREALISFHKEQPPQ